MIETLFDYFAALPFGIKCVLLFIFAIIIFFIIIYYIWKRTKCVERNC